MSKLKPFSVFLALSLVLLTSTLAGASSSAPYPPSTVVEGITFDTDTFVRKASGSDNWAVTWGPDDNIYTTWGDGEGFGGRDAGMGVARIEGPPENFVGTNLWGVPRGYTGGKSVGILSVNGVLYMFAGPKSGRTAWTETWLQWSNDLGKTWQLSEIFFRHTDGFAKPNFLNFGRDYAGARDEFIYVYGVDASHGFGERAVKLNLARVHKKSIKDRSAYEFFKGLDGNGSPLWTSDVAKRSPVFVDAMGGISDSPSVIFNSALNRYFISKTHNTKQSKPPHGGLGIFDAPNPWGPWTTVKYVDKWMGSTKMYFATFPTKWISSDGLTMWMVYTGYGNIAKDAYQHMKGVLKISADSDSVPPAPPKNLKVEK